jgi:hypothetical protein
MYLPFQRGYDKGRELLKWFALASMTLDHIGLILYSEYLVLRYVGRLAFPFFAYLLVLGFESTRDVKKYFLRLFIFGFISQIPFFLARGVDPWESLNIFFTLSLGVLFIHLLENNSYFSILPILASFVIPVNYGIYGLLMIGCFYILRIYKWIGVISFFFIHLLFSFNLTSQYLDILAIPFILLHNDRRFPFNRIEYKVDYPIWKKYFFYVYYPFHLFLLYLLKINF